MTQQDKLQKIIAKAVENGWSSLPKDIEPTYENIMANVYYMHKAILFDHSFAKAIWGEDEIIYYENL